MRIARVPKGSCRVVALEFFPLSKTKQLILVFESLNPGAIHYKLLQSKLSI